MKKILTFIILSFTIINNGQAQTSGRTQVTGGFEITIDQRPFQIALQRSNNPHCGGSILNQRWIITAAHCVQNIPIAQLRVGIGITGQNQIGNHGQVRTISRVIIHPNYNNESLDNDIALLELNTPITYNVNAQPVRIINNNNNPLINPGQISSVSGWGWITPGTASRSNTLRQVNVPIISNVEADRQLDISEPRHPALTANMVATGFLGSVRQGACYGDSGGPLTAENSAGIDYLTGVVSWGVDNCTGGNNSPTVYTNVTNYQEWIYRNICQTQVTVNEPIFADVLIEASNTVSSGSQVNGQAGVLYQAGGNVILTPGFSFAAQGIGNLTVRIGSNCAEGTLSTAIASNSTSLNTNNNAFNTETVSAYLTVYPNPVNDKATIKYIVPSNGRVRIHLTDSRGLRLKDIFVKDNHEAGSFEIESPTKDLRAGMYFCTLETLTKKETKKLIIEH